MVFSAKGTASFTRSGSSSEAKPEPVALMASAAAFTANRVGEQAANANRRESAKRFTKSPGGKSRGSHIGPALRASIDFDDPVSSESPLIEEIPTGPLPGVRGHTRAESWVVLALLLGM